MDGSKHLLIRNEDIMLIYDKGSLSIDNVHPAHDRLLVQLNKARETTSGGIVIPQASNSGDVVEGKVSIW